MMRVFRTLLAALVCAAAAAFVCAAAEADADVAKILDCISRGTISAIAPLLVQFGSFRHAQDVELVTCEQMADRYRKEGI